MRLEFIIFHYWSVSYLQSVYNFQITIMLLLMSFIVFELEWIQAFNFGDELNLGSCKILLHDRCPHEYVNFYFYSSKNSENSSPELVEIGETITESNIIKLDFYSELPTKIIIHGYNSDVFIPALSEIRKEYLKLKNVNVFLVDWSILVQEPCYFAAVHNSFKVGKCIARFVTYLRALLAEDIHLIGFSLGAHVASFAANNLKPYKVSRITGLDPAQPKFMFVDKDMKLDSSDAKFVDVYHTNAFLQGISESVGHVDFYMNGGIIQPGCWAETRFFACNHHRAPIYFAESISSKLGFWGWPCDSYFNYLIGRCVFNGYQVQVGENTDQNLRGLFLVITSSTSPFALGKYMGPIVEIKNNTEITTNVNYISQFQKDLDYYDIENFVTN